MLWRWVIMFVINGQSKTISLLSHGYRCIISQTSVENTTYLKYYVIDKCSIIRSLRTLTRKKLESRRQLTSNIMSWVNSSTKQVNLSQILCHGLTIRQRDNATENANNICYRNNFYYHKDKVKNPEKLDTSH